MTFESALGKELERDKQRMFSLDDRERVEAAPLLDECTAWQAQIENAIAAHADVKELETAKMGA